MRGFACDQIFRSFAPRNAAAASRFHEPITMAHRIDLSARFHLAANGRIVVTLQPDTQANGPDLRPTPNA